VLAVCFPQAWQTKDLVDKKKQECGCDKVYQYVYKMIAPYIIFVKIVVDSQAEIHDRSVKIVVVKEHVLNLIPREISQMN
jgi:hypothetical protein